MQVPPLSEEDRKELLSRPVVAECATVSASGDIRMTPIWFGERDGALLMNTFENSALVKNLRRNPRCSVMVHYSDKQPYYGVHYQGAATVEGPENDVEGMAQLFARYRGSVEDAREYAKLLVSWGKRVYVRFRPERSTTWDFRQAG